jgi:type I restriction enzyme R subunit
MSNFAFPPTEFRAIVEAAAKAEGHILRDYRAACFHVRFTQEAIVHWLYRHGVESRRSLWAAPLKAPSSEIPS